MEHLMVLRKQLLMSICDIILTEICTQSNLMVPIAKFISLYRLQKCGYKLYLRLSENAAYPKLAGFLYERALAKSKFADRLENIILEEASKIESFRFDSEYINSHDGAQEYIGAITFAFDEQILEYSIIYQISAIEEYNKLLSISTAVRTEFSILKAHHDEMLNSLNVLYLLDEFLFED